MLPLILITPVQPASPPQLIRLECGCRGRVSDDAYADLDLKLDLDLDLDFDLKCKFSWGKGQARSLNKRSRIYQIQNFKIQNFEIANSFLGSLRV